MLDDPETRYEEQQEEQARLRRRRPAAFTEREIAELPRRFTFRDKYGNPLELYGEHEGYSAKEINEAFICTYQDPSWTYGHTPALFDRLPLKTQLWIVRLYEETHKVTILAPHKA